MKTQLSAVVGFGATSVEPAANVPANHFFRHSYRRAIGWAYSLGAKPNGWEYCQFHICDDFVCLQTFLSSNQPHRVITMWKEVDRDNDGYLFSVHTKGRNRVFQTNNLRHALGNFKTPKPVLGLAPVRS